MAALLILVVGVGIPLLMRPSSPVVDPLATLADAAETDHVRSLLANHLTDVASSDHHTVKPWFAGRLDFVPNVPELAAHGFPLVGGRLDLLDHRQVAALVYSHGQHTINLFLWPADVAHNLPVTPAARSTTSGHHLLLWNDGPIDYCAISDVDASELLDFATFFRAADAASPASSSSTQR